MSSYEPVQNTEEDLGVFTIDDDDGGDGENILQRNGRLNGTATSAAASIDISDDDDDKIMLSPLEIMNDDNDDTTTISSTDGFASSLTLFSWMDPWFPNMLAVCLLVIPLLLAWMWFYYHLIGQWWILSPFMCHAWIALTSTYTIVRKEHTLNHSCWRTVATFTFWVDVVLLSVAYPLVANSLVEMFWTEHDDSIVVEYQNDVAFITWMILLSYVTVGLRIFIGSTALLTCCCSSLCRGACCPRCVASCLACLDGPRHGWSPLVKENFKKSVRYLLGTASLVALVAFVGCLVSGVRRFGTWEAPVDAFYKDCDPLDTTECWLPFPSFHHMVSDDSTETGWRVNLHPRRLPPLKGRRLMDPTFLNELDGFSTMAPMMFYMEGLKEGVENEMGGARLMGATTMAESVGQHSLTLLMDVTAQTLVPHSAEIDYLDPERPVVLMFPAQPLSHNHHYAVAVANAVDKDGQRLPTSPALAEVLYGVNTTSTKSGTTRSHLDPGRAKRYQNDVLPLLKKLAPWLGLSDDPAALQLMFDFVTVSSEAQLGPVRKVRDSTLTILNDDDWNWMDNVQDTKQEDYDCDANDGTLLARTIYADMTVPWFLDSFGPGHRMARLDRDAVAWGKPRVLGTVKFVVHIPCSVRNAILDGDEDVVQAVMDYGHSLFYNLNEASSHYLQDIANTNRYVITGMDWRGMSSHDLIVVAKAMLTRPSVFESVRDNLIQGYAAKFALQHFVQNALFKTNWFLFEDKNAAGVASPGIDGKTTTRVFYGNSQGGILGAGYSALAGPSLVDRVILGVPGVSFSLVMTRSDAFTGYDDLLLLSMYNNRHVRFVLYLLAMAWDSTEGSGVLAPPIEEAFPPTLLQAGLGDSTVTTIATEALARAYGAVILPNNPRQDIYLINAVSGAGTYSTNENCRDCQATLTELFFAQEYANLPVHDVLPEPNDVHYCTRMDKVMIHQMTEFINTGTVKDVCENDACQRVSADCD